jgi:phage baseplate assembly protein W
MTDVPRLAWPMTLSGTRLATIEQDSDDDINQCVRLVLLHRVGDRDDQPDMGVPDDTFAEQPLDTAAIVAAVERHEPRVAALAGSTIDSINSAIAEIDLTWQRIPQPDTEA